MKVAVIGAYGNMGSVITKNLSKAGNDIYVYGPDAKKLSEFVATVQKEIPTARITKTNDAASATRAAEVIIPAVWYEKQAEIAKDIRKDAAGKIVVNIANPLNKTYDGLATPPNTSAAEEFAKLLPNSKIVKAFNTAFAGDYANPDFGGIRPNIFVASDDEKAADVVSKLVKDAGFDPLYVGKLSASRILEQMTVLLISVTSRYNYNWVAGWRILHR